MCLLDEDDDDLEQENKVGASPHGQEATSPVSGEDYRRLQAQCVVLAEAAQSLEQLRAEDKVQLAQLEEECKRLRSTLRSGGTDRSRPPATDEQQQLATSKAP